MPTANELPSDQPKMVVQAAPSPGVLGAYRPARRTRYHLVLHGTPTLTATRHPGAADCTHGTRTSTAITARHPTAGIADTAMVAKMRPDRDGGNGSWADVRRTGPLTSWRRGATRARS